MKITLKHILLLFSILFYISVTSIFPAPGEELDPKLWKKALKIHEKAIVIDTHCDTPMVMMGDKMDIGQRQDDHDVDLVRMKEGGVDAMFFAAYVSNRRDSNQPARFALEMIDEIHRQIENNPDKAELAVSPDDIRRIHKTGKRAILIGIENGGPVEGSLRLLRTFYRLGVRYITLTHNSHNHICDSSRPDEPKWDGVSDFGKEVIKEMNRIGMLIDVSHISDKAFWDVLKHSEAPVFASHSSVRAICNVKRNLTDEMIKALAEKGGVIQITFCSFFLDESFKEKWEVAWDKLRPLRKELREKYKDNPEGFYVEFQELSKKHLPEPPPVERLIDHIDHVVKLVGIDHVGLGSDYDGTSSVPKGLKEVSGFPLITYHLLKRGYSEKDINKIMGGNFLTMFEKVIQFANQQKPSH